jgi:hypothetical protein
MNLQRQDFGLFMYFKATLITWALDLRAVLPRLVVMRLHVTLASMHTRDGKSPPGRNMEWYVMLASMVLRDSKSLSGRYVVVCNLASIVNQHLVTARHVMFLWLRGMASHRLESMQWYVMLSSSYVGIVSHHLGVMQWYVRLASMVTRGGNSPPGIYAVVCKVVL